MADPRQIYPLDFQRSLIVALLFAAMAAPAHAKDPLSALPLPEWHPRFPAKALLGEPTSPLAIAMGLTRLYGTPVHFEQPAMGADGRPFDEKARFAYQIDGTDTLRAALDRAVALWPNSTRWTPLGARSVVIRSDPAPPKHDLLTTRVSVSPARVSIWEALQQLGGTILRSSGAYSQMDIWLPGLSKGHRPPAALLEPEVIPALVLEDVEAREALAQVLEFAPFTLRYSYLVRIDQGIPTPYLRMHAYARSESEHAQLLLHKTGEFSSAELQTWNERTRIGVDAGSIGDRAPSEPPADSSQADASTFPK